MDGFFKKVGTAFDRGAESYGLSLATFMRGRQAQEFTNRIDKGGAIFVPVEEGRNPREAALNAFRNLAQGQGVDSFGLGADRGKDRRELRPIELEYLRQHVSQLQRLQSAKQAIQDHRSVVAKVGSDSLLAQGVYDATGSLPYMGMAFMGPIGQVVNGAVMAEDNFRQLKASNPEVDDNTLRNVADAAAVPQALIERMQAKTLLGNFPGSKKYLAKLAGGGFMKQLIVRQGAEFTQELAQDAMLPLAQKMLAAVDSDVPDIDLTAALGTLAEQAPRTFFATLPLSILGAGTSATARRFRGSDLTPMMKDEASMQRSGITAEEAAEVAATEDTGEAVKLFQKFWQGKTPEQRMEASKAAESAKREASSLPVIEARTDGKLDVAYPDGTRETVATEEQAATAHGAWVENHFEGQRRISEEAIGASDLEDAFDEESARFIEARPGVAVTETEGESIGDLRRRGMLTISQAYARVKDYAAQTGTSLEGFTPSDFDSFRVQGSASSEARFVNGVLEGAVTLARGDKNVATLWEEQSETYMTAQLNEGGTWTDAELTDELRRVERQTGQSFLSGESRENLVEGFSFVARNYAAGNFADLNFGQKLKHVLNLLSEKIAAVFTLSKGIRELTQKGELSPAIETAIRESLGFDGNQEAEMGRMRNDATARLAGDTLAVAPIGEGAREIKSAPEVVTLENPFPENVTTPPSLRKYFQKHFSEITAEWPAIVETGEGPIAWSKSSTGNRLSAFKKGEPALLHFIAAANLPKLLKDSVLAAVHTDTKGDRNVVELHRRYAWADFPNGERRHVLMTVKRMSDAASVDKQANDQAYSSEVLGITILPKTETANAVTSRTEAETGSPGDQAIALAADENLGRFLAGIKPEHQGRTLSITRDGESLLSLVEAKAESQGVKAEIWKRIAAELRGLRERADTRAAEMAGFDEEALNRELASLDLREEGETAANAARLEADLQSIEDRREEERAFNAQNLDRLELDEGVALQDQGERLLAKWGDDGAKRRMAMAEARKTVAARYVGLRAKEAARHRAAMKELNQRDKNARKEATTRDEKSTQKLRDRERNLQGQADRFNERQARFELVQDIATLEAIGKALPLAIRGKIVGDFKRLAELRSTASRQTYLSGLLPKVERVFEGYLRKEYRKAIKSQLKRGAAKISEGRNRSSSIGAVAAAIFEEAKAAMKLADDSFGDVGGKTASEKASLRSDELTVAMEAASEMSAEQIEELVGRQEAVELLGDYGNANSSRRAVALDFLSGAYADGRAERVALLLSRREVRESRVGAILKGLGIKGASETAARVKRTRKDEKFLKGMAEGFMGVTLSGSQVMRRLRETTNDAGAIATVEDMENAFTLAEIAEQDLNLLDNENYVEAAGRILGVKSKYGFAKKLSELRRNTEGNIPVSKIEGFREEAISIPIRQVEAIFNGELDSLEAGGVEIKQEWRDLSEADLDQLEGEWELFNELTEEERKRKRSIKFKRKLHEGERKSLGELSQLEGLNWLLILRQPDQAAKLEGMGWDAQTVAELEEWLKPEVKALGKWMVDDLLSDRDTLKAIHREEKGIGLAILDGPYFPVTNEVSAAELESLALDGIGRQGGGRSVGSLKMRVPNNAEPAVVNAIAVYLGHKAQMNFWKSNVGLLRECGGIIRDERFAMGVKNSMGSEYYAALKRRLDRIEGGGSLRKSPLLWIERIFKKFVRGFALGTLGGRVSTLAVNTAAFANVTLEVPITELLPGMLDVMANPAAFKDAWASPAICRRLKGGATFEAQLAKQKGTGMGPAMAVLDAAAMPAMEAINIVDTGANTVAAAFVWERTRKLAIAQGATDAESRAAADRKVEIVMARAAQPTLRFARSEFELTLLESPLALPFAMFMSEARKTTSIGAMALRQLFTGKGSYTKGMAVQQAVMAFVVFKVFEQSIRALVGASTKGEDDDEETYTGRVKERLTDPKAWTYALTADHLTAIPGLGEAGKSGLAASLNSDGAKWIVENTMPADFATRWEESEARYFGSNPNPLAKTGRGISTLGKSFSTDLTAEERADAIIDTTQVFGSLIPGAAIAAQVANVGESALGAFNTFGGSLSEADKVKLLKTRYSAAKRELDELHGPTMRETGKLDSQGNPRKKLDKETAAKKHAALADRLIMDLAPLSTEMREAALQSIDPPETVTKRVHKAFLPK